MQQNITAEQKMIKKLVLLYKETEGGKLNFKLSHLSLSIDWVFLIKINFELEYHYLLSSPESMPFSYLFFLFFLIFFSFPFSPLYWQLLRKNYPIVYVSNFLFEFFWKYICMVSLTPDTLLRCTQAKSDICHVGTRRVCDFSQTEENPNSALP